MAHFGPSGLFVMDLLVNTDSNPVWRGTDHRGPVWTCLGLRASEFSFGILTYQKDRSAILLLRLSGFESRDEKDLQVTIY